MTGNTNAKIQDFWVGFSVGQFNPTDQMFKELYGSGMQWRIVIGADILKWLSLWMDTVNLKKTGELTVTKEESQLKASYLNAGIRFKFPLKKFVPFLGGGVGVVSYHEENPIGKARDKDGNFFGEAGLSWKMSKLFHIDFRVLYNWCQIRPELLKVNIGGISTSLGISFYFGQLFKEKKPKVWEW